MSERHEITSPSSDFIYWIDKPGQWVTFTVDDDGKLVISSNANCYRPDRAGATRLSKMLWGARESLEMWADVVEGRTGTSGGQTRELIAEIDAYRAEHGWSPNGFGGESA